MLMQLLSKLLLMLLHGVHLIIIIFCITGWLFVPLRHWHLAMCGLVLASWFGLGIWKGWGYCLVTDIQWRLLRMAGKTPPPYGYMPMLWQRITGQAADAQLVDKVTEWFFYILTAASLWVNWSWLRTLV